MKPIYLEILSEGENGVSDSSGENAKGENLGLIAGAELFRMVELFPEMLEMLKQCVFAFDKYENNKMIINYHSHDGNAKIKKLIAKAEGHE